MLNAAYSLLFIDPSAWMDELLKELCCSWGGEHGGGRAYGYNSTPMTKRGK